MNFRITKTLGVRIYNKQSGELVDVWDFTDNNTKSGWKGFNVDEFESSSDDYPKRESTIERVSDDRKVIKRVTE